MNQDQKKVTIVMPTPLIEAIRSMGKLHRRSFNAEMLWALEQYLESQNQEER